MFKVFLLIFGLICGATAYNPSDYTDPAVIATASYLVGNLTALLNQYIGIADNGIINQPLPPLPATDLALFNQTLLTLPGNLYLSAGLLALPTNITCGIPQGPLYNLNCYIGSSDCTFVHNKYGGNCGKVNNPIPGTTQVTSDVFICNEKNPSPGNKYFATGPSSSCGPVFGINDIDNGLYYGIATFIRQRYMALQCPVTALGIPLNSGCTSDCRNNHNYAGGTCTTNSSPTATFPGELAVGYNCVCTDPVY